MLRLLDAHHLPLHANAAPGYDRRGRAGYGERSALPTAQAAA